MFASGIMHCSKGTALHHVSCRSVVPSVPRVKGSELCFQNRDYDLACRAFANNGWFTWGLPNDSNDSSSEEKRPEGGVSNNSSAAALSYTFVMPDWIHDGTALVAFLLLGCSGMCLHGLNMLFHNPEKLDVALAAFISGAFIMYLVRAPSAPDSFPMTAGGALEVKELRKMVKELTSRATDNAIALIQKEAAIQGLYRQLDRSKKQLKHVDKQRQLRVHQHREKRGRILNIRSTKQGRHRCHNSTTSQEAS